MTALVPGGAAGPPAPVTPHPLGATLPAVYQEDAFAQRLCAALDLVLAPVITTLDALPAYLDPATAPEEMVAWLGSWVGLSLGDAWPAERRRSLVAHAAWLHAWRGTRTCLERAVELATGEPPQIVESGATAVSNDASAAMPGGDVPSLVVRVRRDALGGVDERSLRELLALLVPAHVPWELEIG